MEDILRKLHDSFSPFPVNEDKSPVTHWAMFREKKIKFETLLKYDKFAIVCGFDNLEVIDIDNHIGNADTMLEFVMDNLPDELLDRLPIIKTKGGGYHIYIKSENIENNQKLALKLIIENDVDKHIIKINPKGKEVHQIKLDNGDLCILSFNEETKNWQGQTTLIETRGIGGYVLCPPTAGYDVISGDMFNVPTLLKEEREMLISICRAINEVGQVKTTKKQKSISDDEKPGEKYNNDPSSINETINLLLSNGWETKDNKHFKRPGKESKGISATFGKVGINKFYVFSSNAHPFELNTSYSMFGVYTMLEHNGDYSSAAKELSKRYDMQNKLHKKEVLGSMSQEEKKEKKATSSQVKWWVLQKIIKEWELNFRFNELTKVIEFTQEKKDWQQLGQLPNDIIKEMELSRGVPSISMNKIIEMISSTDIAESYNPIRVFYDSLPDWDGEDHIAKICRYIELQEGEDSVFFYNMLKKHLVRTIRCAIEKDYVNRMVFVFYSASQEIGKTLFFKWLCPGELYDDEMIDPSSKDSLLKLGRYLMINLDELDSLQKKEVAKLKAFISKGEIKTRVAYGRFDECFYRTASLFGSTNKNDLLADETNTRWLILKVKSFNWQGYTKEIKAEDLWAQAKGMYLEDKESGELTKDEKRERERRNSQMFLETSSEREILIKWFEEGNQLMTATEIKQSIELKLYPQKIVLTQLVRELKRIFGEPKLQANDKGKVGRYYKLRNNLENTSNPFASNYAEVEKIDAPPF